MDETTLVRKLGIIERCRGRAREEYDADPASFADDRTRQDAATLNVLRAWEALIEMADGLLADAGFGQAADERAVIALLVERGWLDAATGEDLKRIGEFCRAEWDLQAAPLPALVTIVKRGLDEVEACARDLLARAASGDGAT